MVISIWAFYAMAIVAVVCLIAYLGNKYGTEDQVSFLEGELAKARFSLGHAEEEARNFRKMAEQRYDELQTLEMSYRSKEILASNRGGIIEELRKRNRDLIRERDGAIKTMDNALSNRDKISKALAKEQAVSKAYYSGLARIFSMETQGMAHIGKRMLAAALDADNAAFNVRYPVPAKNG